MDGKKGKAVSKGVRRRGLLGKMASENKGDLRREKEMKKKKDRIVSCVEGLLSEVTVIIVYAAVQVTAEQDTSKTGR